MIFLFSAVDVLCLYRELQTGVQTWCLMGIQCAEKCRITGITSNWKTHSFLWDRDCYWSAGDLPQEYGISCLYVFKPSHGTHILLSTYLIMFIFNDSTALSSDVVQNRFEYWIIYRSSSLADNCCVYVFVDWFSCAELSNFPWLLVFWFTRANSFANYVVAPRKYLDT